MRASADLREIELAKARGELIPVDEAVRIWEDAIERIRVKLMASISSYGPHVVAVTTAPGAKELLEEIIYRALGEVSALGDELEREVQAGGG